MTRKRGGRTAPQPWEPFREVTPSRWMVEQLTGAGWMPGAYTVWKNNRFTVYRRYCIVPDDAPFWVGEPVIHLSIKRNDRGVVRDWRHLQRIKNELVDKESEAVELFPAESRLIDEANQYHLWCVRPGLQFPFGGMQRLVAGPEEAATRGARQRAFDNEEEA